MSGKIFIVEDNRFYGHLLKSEIEKFYTHQVEVFTSGEAFINNMHQNPDIVIMDHHLGTYQGVDLVKQIKGSHPQSEVILLSGQNKMSVAVNAFKYGAYDYVEKNQRTFQKLELLIKKIQFEINERRNSRIQKVLAYAGLTVGLSTLLIWTLS